MTSTKSTPSENEPRPGTITVIASGKGGTGKTFVATSMASALGSLGQKTLLVDGDLGLSNVDVQLGIAPETDLAAVVAGWVELKDAITPVRDGNNAGGFDFLPGRSGSGALAELSTEEVARIAVSISKLTDFYDQIVIDLGPGIHSEVMRLARSADRAIIVITDEPSAMTDAYAFIKVLKGYKPSIQPLLLVNKAKTRAQAKKLVAAVTQATQTFLGFRPRLIGAIPLDVEVENAIMTQTPLADRAPDSAAYKSMLKAALNLLAEENPIVAAQGTADSARTKPQRKLKPITSKSNLDDLVDVLSEIARPN